MADSDALRRIAYMMALARMTNTLPSLSPGMRTFSSADIDRSARTSVPATAMITDGRTPPRIRQSAPSPTTTAERVLHALSSDGDAAAAPEHASDDDDDDDAAEPTTVREHMLDMRKHATKTTRMTERLIIQINMAMQLLHDGEKLSGKLSQVTVMRDFSIALVGMIDRYLAENPPPT
jgi:hypothetical protein